MERIVVCRVCRGTRRNNQLVKAKVPCKPEVLTKAAAAKFKLKKPKELSLLTTIPITQAREHDIKLCLHKLMN